MVLSVGKDGILAFNLNRKFKKYILNLKIKTNYLNYETFSKIKYEDIVTIIENIENMLFGKYINLSNVELNKIKIRFNEDSTQITFAVELGDMQMYSVTLNRTQVLKFYNYLTREINTLNKVKMIDFNKKYTYVEVRYIDVYSSKKYSYISEDKSIEIGDIVYVDRAGTKCLAVVEDRDEFFYEDAPYPVLETKRVIKIVTRVGEYKDLLRCTLEQ